MIDAHREWLGYVQPVGMVVAPAALVRRSVVPDRHVAPVQQRLLDAAERDRDGRFRRIDPKRLLIDVLRWRESDLVDPTAEFEKVIPELNDTLRPSWTVPDPERADGAPAAQLLIAVEPDDVALDEPLAGRGDRWHASPQARFERLLRETGVPTGVILTGRAVRLVHAPKGESSGHITFDLAAASTFAGRPILAALDMLLGAERLFVYGREERLPALLAESRKAQAEVSVALSSQVLAALYELLRGFVAADARGGTRRIAELAERRPDDLYGGLLAALMRLVFVLYAEDRGLMSSDPVYVQHYSLAGLFQQLRADAALHPDTMDQRFGAWAQTLALWRLIHGGGAHAGMRLVARRGRLFDPERYPFLEGREAGDPPGALPPVPDGTVWKILENLMVLDGERLSYRTLDVEQIGSVYETIMGFTVETTTGRSIAVRSSKSGGAAAVVDLDALLAQKPADRAKWLAERAERKLTGAPEAALKSAGSVEDALVALEKVIDRAATPQPVPPGTPVLQPTDERRRSGSHYTPRSLTEPIVREALRPVLERLGPSFRPEQILDLKVLDPAMGSGAFLVEACRQLAEALVKAWAEHGGPPPIPADEDEVLHARRLVAQRCLYGVDKNAMAVDLARLSLWLATLARDHEFTFVDHALRHGDSLVGLMKKQIAAMHWAPAPSIHMSELLLRDRIAEADAERRRIREAVGEQGEIELRPYLDRADRALDDVRLVADAVVSSFFEGEKPRERELERGKALELVERGGRNWQQQLRPLADRLRPEPHPIAPLHWEIEFPEVFQRQNPGFDVIVGNPPFGGKNTITAAHRDGFLDWLKAIHEGAHGNADFVAHFFRRGFTLLRSGGTFGLIATNTIRQGDTRATGLRWIVKNGGTIYAARRRHRWEGAAAVVVSIVHIAKGAAVTPRVLDGRGVERITAFLVQRGGDDDPAVLRTNVGKSSQGSIVLGMGFTFDDTDKKGVASPVSEMRRLIDIAPRNAERIFPYIGGEEFNDSPQQEHHRYVINFGEMGENEAREWPELIEIVERNAGTRASHSTAPWWQFERRRSEFYRSIAGLPRVLAVSRIGDRFGLAFLPTGMVYAETLVIFAFHTFPAFAVLQSRMHELWARFFSSSMKDDLRYTSNDCFDTFPMPENFETNVRLEQVGRDYYDFRADLMIQNSQGLTQTYNRFHDPGDLSTAVSELRRLHDQMDRAVLDAYGWSDIIPTCEFELEWADDSEAQTRRKKPWRYRWPESVRDEVLARLLELNRQRADAERVGGAANVKKRARRVKASAPRNLGSSDLLSKVAR